MKPNCNRTPQENGWPVASDIDAIVEAMAETCPIRSILLFGSGATGELDENSDLDLAFTPTGPAPFNETGDLLKDADNAARAKRRRTNAVARAARKAAGPRRALDVIDLPDGATHPGDNRIDLADGSRRAVLLHDNGRTIGWTDAHKPPVDATSSSRKRLIGRSAIMCKCEAVDFLDAATRRAGRANRGPTERHRIAHMASMAPLWRLRSHVIAETRRKPRDAELHRALYDALPATTRECAQISDRTLDLLERHRRRWTFDDDPLPDFDEALACVHRTLDLFISFTHGDGDAPTRYRHMRNDLKRRIANTNYQAMVAERTLSS